MGSYLIRHDQGVRNELGKSVLDELGVMSSCVGLRHDVCGVVEQISGVEQAMFCVSDDTRGKTVEREVVRDLVCAEVLLKEVRPRFP